MILGPKQTILVASAITTGASYVIGKTGQANFTASVNRPIAGTFGAKMVVLRMYGTSATNASTVAISSTLLHSWSSAALATPLACTGTYCVPGGNISAQAVSNFLTAATGRCAWIEGVSSINTGGSALTAIPYEALLPTITIAVEDITSLTVEARCLYDAGLRDSSYFNGGGW